LGSVTVYENEVIEVTGLAITSAIGGVSTTADANAILTGVAITSSLGSVLIWSLIDESQTPSYSGIDESQTADWEEVA